MSRQRLQSDLENHLAITRVKSWRRATPAERLAAVCLAVRRFAGELLEASESRYAEADAKRLYYLSMEFLMGRSLVRRSRFSSTTRIPRSWLRS